MRVFLASAAALLSCVLAAPAGAAPIVVDTTADAIAGSDGHCSVYEAFQAANTNSASGLTAGECPAGEELQRDTISIPAGNYNVSAGLAMGPTAGPVTISGAGADSTTITQQSAARLIAFYIAQSDVIEDITLTGGHPGLSYNDSGDQVGGGGAIQVVSGTLTIERCVITGNHAADGSVVGGNPFSNGGAWGGAIANAGSLTIRDSELTDNRAGHGVSGASRAGTNGVTPGGQPGADGGSGIGENGYYGGHGGAISNTGHLVVERTVFSGNHAGNGGDAGDGTGGDGGQGSAVGSHGGAGGPGIGGAGADGGSGGAIYDNSGDLSVTDSTFSSNAAGNGGAAGDGFGGKGGRGADGGIGHGGAGGAGGSGFTSGAGPGGHGGAIAFPAYVTTTNAQPVVSGSVFTGNVSGHGGLGGSATGGAGGNAGNGALDGTGGAGGPATAGLGREGGAGGAIDGAGGSGGPVVAGNASPRLTNDTITANTTGDGGAGGSATGGTGGTGTAGGSNGSTGAATNRSGGHGGHGGALSFTALSAVNLTISANATGNGGASGGSGAAAGARGSGGGAYTTTTPAGVYDSIFLDNAPANCPQSLEDYNVDNDGTCGGSGTATLGPLADNGGPTMTQALAPGSFGRDGTGVSDPICMPSDQRGIARPQGDQCDFGAYEVAPPVAVTGSASEISGAGATVAGSVNPNYRVTSYKFEYGTTASYGSSTATQSAGSGNTAAPASVSLTGLMPSTTYHYRLVASSPDGSTNGSDQTFTTSAAPSTGGDGTGTTTGGTGSTGGTPTGPTGNGPGTSTADTTAPLVSRFAIKPKKLKKKTVLKFRLSERARVVIMIKRRGAKKPVRITLQGIAGLNSKTLKRGKLKRGRYTATLVATDAAGNKSAARTIKFRVV